MQSSNTYTQVLPDGSAMKEITEEGRYYCMRWSDAPNPEIYDYNNGMVEVKIIPFDDELEFLYRTLIYMPYNPTFNNWYCRMDHGNWSGWEAFAKINEIKIYSYTGTPSNQPIILVRDGLYLWTASYGFLAIVHCLYGNASVDVINTGTTNLTYSTQDNYIYYDSTKYIVTSLIKVNN